MEDVKDFIFTNGNKIKVVIDVDTLEDPSMFGQILRTHCFKSDNKLENSFKDISKSSIGRKFATKFFNPAEKEVSVYSDGNIYVGIKDLVLAISLNGRTATNSDYNREDWIWHKEIQ